MKVDKEALSRMLLQGPGDIREKQILLYNQALRKEELLVKLRLIEAMAYSDIAAETVPEEGKDGTILQKKRYSNEEARKAAVQSRLKINEPYQVCQKDFDELERKLKIGNIELEFMQRSFSAAKGLARLAVD